MLCKDRHMFVQSVLICSICLCISLVAWVFPSSFSCISSLITLTHNHLFWSWFYAVSKRSFHQYETNHIAVYYLCQLIENLCLFVMWFQSNFVFCAPLSSFSIPCAEEFFCEVSPLYFFLCLSVYRSLINSLLLLPSPFPTAQDLCQCKTNPPLSLKSSTYVSSVWKFWYQFVSTCLNLWLPCHNKQHFAESLEKNLILLGQKVFHFSFISFVRTQVFWMTLWAFPAILLFSFTIILYYLHFFLSFMLYDSY